MPANEALTVVRLTEPARAESLLAGMLGRIGDVVAGDRGTLFLATRNGKRTRDAGGAYDDVIVRFTRPARRLPYVKRAADPPVLPFALEGRHTAHVPAALTRKGRIAPALD